jgi:hypothetical protein
MRFGGDVGSDVSDMDFIPLTKSNRFRHLEMAASKRSWMSNSFERPSNVDASPASTNS